MSSYFVSTRDGVPSISVPKTANAKNVRRIDNWPGDYFFDRLFERVAK